MIINNIRQLGVLWVIMLLCTSDLLLPRLNQMNQANMGAIEKTAFDPINVLTLLLQLEVKRFNAKKEKHGIGLSS
jgi:hypothetical protein